jgi:hypothetical protein
MGMAAVMLVWWSGSLQQLKHGLWLLLAQTLARGSHVTFDPQRHLASIY